MARSTVLERCAAGIDRSGLVVAGVLIEQGMTPAEAITMVRRRRSVDALNNPWLVEWLLSARQARTPVHTVSCPLIVVPNPPGWALPRRGTSWVRQGPEIRGFPKVV